MSNNFRLFFKKKSIGYIVTVLYFVPVAQLEEKVMGLMIVGLMHNSIADSDFWTVQVFSGSNIYLILLENTARIILMNVFLHDEDIAYLTFLPCQ